MKVEQIYTKRLSEASYFICSDGEAVVIDPIRDASPYLRLAEKNKAKIKYILETHLHTDFVSGHLELSRKTGAEIVYGPNAETNYPVYHAKDDELLTVGKIQIKVLYTPGHTLESTCFLAFDEKGNAHSLFSGDTLLIEDVGRPDLVLNNEVSIEDQARQLYDSIQVKLNPLEDSVLLYPGHVHGSPCARHIGPALHSTIGEQRKVNFALKEIDKEDFVKEVVNGLNSPPSYFFENARINRTGYADLQDVLQKNLKALSVGDVEQALEKKGLVIDTREAEYFQRGFIKGAINIGLSGQFAIWTGTLVKIDTPLILIGRNQCASEEAIVRLTQIGYENVLGYLEGGFGMWEWQDKAVEYICPFSLEESATKLKNYQIMAIDVRNPKAYQEAHIDNAIHIPLAQLSSNMFDLNTISEYVVYGDSAYYALMAVSLLQKNGFIQVSYLKGDFMKLQEYGVPMVYQKKKSIISAS
ncbi:MBL fold metallo-hydrolase [Rapidithrix thailandica]|uniref:MBL fold metallo-hydrolase n=1 Tax=Rapidithrix thailandica TaxID=413964 RepID=A0AAW9SFW5_9BACT